MIILCTPAVPSKNEPVAVAADPIRIFETLRCFVEDYKNQ